MFLTKVSLDIRNAHVRKCLYDCQTMHCAVMSFFRSSRKEAGALYRIDKKRLALYILSKKKPEASFADEGFSIVATRDISKVVDGFDDGKMYRFNVMTYPCTQRMGKRSFIKLPEQRLEWLYKTAEKHGFSVLSVKESDKHENVVGSHTKDNGGKFVYRSVVFSGKLRVNDAEKFKNVYCTGIGRGLAYGLGMFLLG